MLQFQVGTTRTPFLCSPRGGHEGGAQPPEVHPQPKERNNVCVLGEKISTLWFFPHVPIVLIFKSAEMLQGRERRFRSWRSRSMCREDNPLYSRECRSFLGDSVGREIHCRAHRKTGMKTGMNGSQDLGLPKEPACLSHF